MPKRNSEQVQAKYAKRSKNAIPLEQELNQTQLLDEKITFSVEQEKPAEDSFMTEAKKTEDGSEGVSEVNPAKEAPKPDHEVLPNALETKELNGEFVSPHFNGKRAANVFSAQLFKKNSSKKILFEFKGSGYVPPFETTNGRIVLSLLEDSAGPVRELSNQLNTAFKEYLQSLENNWKANYPDCFAWAALENQSSVFLTKGKEKHEGGKWEDTFSVFTPWKLTENPEETSPLFRDGETGEELSVAGIKNRTWTSVKFNVSDVRVYNQNGNFSFTSNLTELVLGPPRVLQPREDSGSLNSLSLEYADVPLLSDLLASDSNKLKMLVTPNVDANNKPLPGYEQDKQLKTVRFGSKGNCVVFKLDGGGQFPLEYGIQQSTVGFKPLKAKFSVMGQQDQEAIVRFQKQILGQLQDSKEVWNKQYKSALHSDELIQSKFIPIVKTHDEDGNPKNYVTLSAPIRAQDEEYQGLDGSKKIKKKTKFIDINGKEVPHQEAMGKRWKSAVVFIWCVYINFKEIGFSKHLAEVVLYP